MSRLNKRLEQLNKLRSELANGPKERKLTVFSYIQLLDYHIALVDELDRLIDAVNNGDQEFVEKWYKYRITNEIPKLEP